MIIISTSRVLFFFFNDTATTEIYTLSLHDALPISEVLGHDTPMTVAVDDDGLFCNRRRGLPNLRDAPRCNSSGPSVFMLLRSRVLVFCALGPLGLRPAMAVSASLFRCDRNRPRENAHNGNDGEPLLPHTSLPQRAHLVHSTPSLPGPSRTSLSLTSKVQQQSLHHAQNQKRMRRDRRSLRL